MSGSEDVQVRRDDAAGRFEILVDGVVAGQADYSDGPDGVREFTHTVVASEFSGRGLAGKLVGEALSVTRDEKLRVRPTCSFVAGYLEKHPEAADVA